MQSYKFNYILLLSLGAFNGTVPMLIGSTLFVWLNEYGFNLKTISLYSLSHLPFVFSFVISIILEYMIKYHWFSYKKVIQINIIIVILLLYGITVYIKYPYLLFWLCFIISICATTISVITNALQKVIVDKNQITKAISATTIGYRIGIVLSGAVALYFSQLYSWINIYYCLISVLILCFIIISTFPSFYFYFRNNISNHSLLKSIINIFSKIYKTKQLYLILLLMFFFRAPDNLITHYLNLLYLNQGINKTQIAIGYKFYGLVMATLGGCLCIFYVKKYSYLFTLKSSLLLHLLSYFLLLLAMLFNVLDQWFYFVVSIEEFTRGMTMIIFWSYQIYLIEEKNIFIGLAIFTGVDALSNSMLGVLGGSIIYYLGYDSLVLLCIIAFIPSLTIIKLLK